MYDKGKIITGLIIGLVLLLFPIWYNLPTAAPPPPDPKLTEKAKAAGQCIQPKALMKSSHMQILDDWRTAVVREGERFILLPDPEDKALEMQVVDELRDRILPMRRRLQVGSQGRLFEMSLQKTCLDCHSSKKDFCDQCHNYVAVTPFCWDCHVEPEEKK